MTKSKTAEEAIKRIKTSFNDTLPDLSDNKIFIYSGEDDSIIPPKNQEALLE